MSVDTKTVKVEVLINSAIVPVKSIIFNHTIDQLPTVAFATQIDNRQASATQIDLPLFMSYCRTNQEYLVNRFRTGFTNEEAVVKGFKSDLAIRAVDGDGKVLNFSGFLSAPSFEVMFGQLGLGFGGVHSMQALQNFNLNLYPMPEFYALKTITLPKGDNESSNSVGTHIDAIVKSVLQQFEDEIEPTNANFKELKETHRINKAAYNGFLQNFLSVSKRLTVMPLVDLQLPQQVANNVQARLDQEIFRILFSAPNFLLAIQQICEDFKFQMNANWNGQAWLELIKMHEDPGTREIVAPIQNIKFNVAASIEAPVSRVYVRAGKLDLYAYAPNNLSLQSNLRQMVAYPPITKAEQEGTPSKLASGVAYIVDAPSWVSDSVTTPAIVRPVDDSNLTIADTLAKFRGLEQTFVDQAIQRQNILQWLAEYTFREHLLKYATAYVSTPLNLAVEVGKTYTVKATDGTPLFTGYLAAVSHTINVEEKGAEATTAMSFSHVKVSGVNLIDLSFAQLVEKVASESVTGDFPGTPQQTILADVQQV